MLTDNISLLENEHIEDLGEGVGVVVSKQHISLAIDTQ